MAIARRFVLTNASRANNSAFKNSFTLQFATDVAGSKQLRSQQFCPDISVYVCLSARSTCAANLPAAADKKAYITA